MTERSDEECSFCGWPFENGGEPYIDTPTYGNRKGDRLVYCEPCYGTISGHRVREDQRTINYVANLILSEIRKLREPRDDR